MIWNFCFIISIICLVLALIYMIYALGTNRNSGILTPLNALFAGVFLAVFVGLVPMFVNMLSGESNFLVKVLVFDFLQTLQVFIIDVGADLVLENINSSATDISNIYSVYMTGLFFIAPLLTFGYLISLFKNLLTDLRFIIRYWKDVYVFSELNEKSIMLARSIKENNEGSLIVFTDVDKNAEELKGDCLEAAKKLKAMVFQKDMLSVDFMKHSKKARLVFFLIGGKEGDNLIKALKLLEKYKMRDHTRLYVFSTGAEGELLMANAPKGKVKVRRVNEVRALVYHFLFEEGEILFKTAVPVKDGRKMITVLIAGLGKYGTEMLKALAWYCQMDGYSLEIHAFDRDELAEEKLSALCPELMSGKYNGVHIPGESEYTIHIHNGVDVRTKTFSSILSSISDISFVFVGLGDDLENINQAANIRMLCERSGSKPVIKTVVYSVEEKNALDGITNYRGQAYGISAIGDLESSYSEEILVGSDLEMLALQRHLKWGEEEEFWQYEYNYRSSMASAIHRKARISCGIPGADKEEKDLTPEERDIIEHLEHRRWNTYMRSEGYVYSGSPEKSSRNDLAKMHHDLVDFESLSEEEKRKDSSIGTL